MSPHKIAHLKASKAAQKSLEEKGLTRETGLLVSPDEIKDAAAAYIESLLYQEDLVLLLEMFFDYPDSAELLEFFKACHRLLIGESANLKDITTKIQTRVAEAHIQEWVEDLPTRGRLALDHYTESLIEQAMHARL